MATLKSALTDALDIKNNPSRKLADAVRKAGVKEFNHPPFADNDAYAKIQGKAKSLIVSIFGSNLGRDITTQMCIANIAVKTDTVRYHTIEHVFNCLYILDKFIPRPRIPEGQDSFYLGALILAFVWHDAYHTQGKYPDVVNITRANSKALSNDEYIFNRAAEVLGVDKNNLLGMVMNIIADSHYPYTPGGHVRTPLSIIFRIIDRSNAVCPGWYNLIYNGLLAEIRVGSPLTSIWDFAAGQVKFISALCDEVADLNTALEILHRDGDKDIPCQTSGFKDFYAVNQHLQFDTCVLWTSLLHAREDMERVRELLVQDGGIDD